MAGYVLSPNERKLVDNISVIDYYNTRVVPNRLDRKFYPLSVHKKAGICPFHPDTDPSFHIWPKSENNAYESFHCFGCKKSGTIVQFHQYWMKENYNKIMDKNAAMLDLAQLYGIELELDNNTGKLKVESPFDIARKKMGLLNEKENKTVSSTMNLTKFKKFNGEVKSKIEQMSQVYEVSDEQVVKMYHQIDLMLSESLAKNKEKSSNA